MSYRSIRNFIEQLRALGYPRPVSMESFRTPNFPLMADLLVWLAQRFDPDADLPLNISTEDKRVKLIQTVAEFMALKAGIKINTKKLYQADGYAIKELLKISTLLYEALNIDIDDTEDSQIDGDSLNLRDFDISDKVNELKLSRQLASEITSSGANLFDLLGQEESLRLVRQRSLGRQLEVNEVEADLKKAVEEMKREIEETKQQIDNISASEANLDAKIERRTAEIDRYEKRLQTLKKVRPAYLEEFTVLEKELEQLFVQYSIRLRCLSYLEKLYVDSQRIELEKQLQQAALPQVQTIPLENFDDNDIFLETEVEQTERTGTVNRQERPRASTGGRNNQKSGKSFGGLQPLLFGSHSSLDLSSDSGSDDELFLDKDEPELMNSDDDSLGLDLSVDKRAPTRVKTANKKQEHDSDDDF